MQVDALHDRLAQALIAMVIEQARYWQVRPEDLTGPAARAAIEAVKAYDARRRS